MGAEAVKVQDIVGLEPETNIKDGVVTVSFPAEAYVNLANSVGIDEKTLKDVKKFNDTFIKDLVVASGDAIMEAYKSDKNAVKHEVNYSTSLNTINIKGGRTEHSVLSGTDNTGMRVQVATDIRGLKATIAAKKKQIFDATR